MFFYSFIVCLLLLFLFCVFFFLFCLVFYFSLSVRFRFICFQRPGEKIIRRRFARFVFTLLELSFRFVSFLLFIFRFQFSFHEFFAFLSLSSWIFRIFWFLSFWQGGGTERRAKGGPLSNPWAALREIASVVQTLGALFNLPLRQCAPFIQSTFRSSPSSLRVCLSTYVCVCVCAGKLSACQQLCSVFLGLIKFNYSSREKKNCRKISTAASWKSMWPC